MSSRNEIVTAGLDALRAHEGISFDRVAARVNLTKAGLMHYFPNKKLLMLALVEAVVGKWEAGLRQHIAPSFADAKPAGPAVSSPERFGPEYFGPEHFSPGERIRAYFDYSLHASFDESDLVMYADPNLRESLVTCWNDRISPWINLDTVEPRHRAGLTSVRLIADGYWLASATGMTPLDVSQRQYLINLVHEQLEHIS